MSKIGVFGGTFDPLHTGHLIVAREAKEILKLDKVLFVPTYISPYKKRGDYSSPSIRRGMIKKALMDIHYFSLEECEIKREGVSYTVDTLKTLRKRYPGSKLYLLVGSDAITNFFKTWKEPDHILQLVTLCVLNRGDGDKVKKYFKIAKNVKFLPTTRIDISSSLVRSRVKKGLPITHYVPEEVKDIIYKYGLYSWER